jgi:hypothetical protein
LKQFNNEQWVLNFTWVRYDNIIDWKEELQVNGLRFNYKVFVIFQRRYYQKSKIDKALVNLPADF